MHLAIDWRVEIRSSIGHCDCESEQLFHFRVCQRHSYDVLADLCQSGGCELYHSIPCECNNSARHLLDAVDGHRISILIWIIKIHQILRGDLASRHDNVWKR